MKRCVNTCVSPPHLDEIPVASGEELQVPLRADDLTKVIQSLTETPLDLVQLLLHSPVEGD